MKSFIFMNHHIRKPATDEPVIAIQTGNKRIYANRINIDGPSVVCSGVLSEITTHAVKAWIECDFADVSVLE